MGRRLAGGCRALSEVYLLVNLFSKLYVTFVLQWIAFIFGRDEEEVQLVCHMQERQVSLSSLCTFDLLKHLSIMPLGVFLIYYGKSESTCILVFFKPTNRIKIFMHS